uniref:Uncharacterized protein n=1 Tax=Anguilla anguilla TaxID=7936 RepID=A0A0E9S726_ANGAN
MVRASRFEKGTFFLERKRSILYMKIEKRAYDSLLREEEASFYRENTTCTLFLRGFMLSEKAERLCFEAYSLLDF